MRKNSLMKVLLLSILLLGFCTPIYSATIVGGSGFLTQAYADQLETWQYFQLSSLFNQSHPTTSAALCPFCL